MNRHPFDPDRRLLRAANAILDGLTDYRVCQRTEAFARLGVLVDANAELTTIARRFSLAADRGLDAVVTRLLGQAQRQARYLTGQTAEVQRALDECDRTGVPTLREIVADLQQTEEEFAQPLRFDAAAGTLAMATDPVELEGLFLGGFDIRLDVRELARMRTGQLYRVVALDPHPAGGADHVTHPHVSNETLCEGDASTAIRSALLAGRLWDFFTLVHNVLTTYNEQSPYVRLDEWHGVTCFDCGERSDEDNLYGCDMCQERFCGECYTWCRVCDSDGCFGCLHRCRACNQLVCHECIESCAACGESVCTSCLLTCQGCEDRICDACVRACDGCDRVLCTPCVGDTGRCGDCRQAERPAAPPPPAPRARAG